MYILSSQTDIFCLKRRVHIVGNGQKVTINGKNAVRAMCLLLAEFGKGKALDRKSMINVLLGFKKEDVRNFLDALCKNKILIQESRSGSLLASARLPTDPTLQLTCITRKKGIAGFSPGPFTIVQVRKPQISARQSINPILGCGVGRSNKEAAYIAVSEAIERYAASVIPWDKLKYGSLQQKPNKRVDPRKFLDLSPAQCRSANLACFNRAKKYFWVEARELISGKRVELLADLCYPLHPEKMRSPIAWANSSGMAAHKTHGKARIAALLELIERNAFMLTWYTKNSPTQIPENNLPKKVIMRRRELLKATGYKICFMNISYRHVPTVLAVAHRKKWPALVVGAATRKTRRDAILVAWKEVEAGIYCRLADPSVDFTDPPRIRAKDIVDPDDHALFYNHPENLDKASFLWQGKEENHIEKGEEKNSFAQICKKAGLKEVYEVWYGQVNSHSIVRLLSPELVPLTFGWDQFPAKQAQKAAISLGMNLGGVPQDALHPFC